MAEQKKQGHLKPETREKLKLSLEMSAEDAVDLMTEAYGQDIFDKKGRGDKVWLYKGAKEALSCMEKIKRVLAMELLKAVTEKLEARKQRPS